MKKLNHIILAITLIMVNCGRQDNSQSANLSESREVVTTAQSKKKTYQPVLELSGSFKPYREANLSAVLPGRVEKIYYQEGQKVSKNDLIVRLAGEKLTQARMEYEAVKKDYGRVHRLYKKGSIPEQKFDHIKAKYEAKKANYEMVRQNTEIRAPFEGTLVETMINEGESFMLINPGMKPGYSHANGVVRLMQLDSLKIEVAVNEKQLSQIEIGQKAKIKTDAYPEKHFQAEIVRISPLVDMSSRTTDLNLAINNSQMLLKPGMMAYVDIILPQKEAVFVPQQAIYRQPGTGRDFVFVVHANEKVEKKAVERITTRDHLVAVQGIPDRTRIVIEGKSKLQDGDQVIATNK